MQRAIQYYGHSCFKINFGGVSLLTDPFIGPNELAVDVKVAEIECDYILISHGHEDHVADAEEIAKKNNACIVSNFEIVSWFQNKGVEKGHPMNHGGEWAFDFGKLKYVNAVHSSVLPDGTYGGNPGGFIIRSEGMNIYFAGDTALHYDMKLLGELDEIDLAILPIGDNFTMGIKDAIHASDFIQCKRIIGMHYDTFGYIKIDKKKAIEAFNNRGKELTLLNIGETISI